MNRTIAEKGSMLSHSKLSKTLWGETVKTVVDLINLFPSRPLNGVKDDTAFAPLTKKEISVCDSLYFFIIIYF